MSSLVRGAFERLARRLKRDPSYRLEEDLSAGDLTEVLKRRAREAIRGELLRRRFRKSARPVFAGSGVVVRHGSHISAGPSLVLGDGVMLDGLSSRGLQFGRNVTIQRGAALLGSGVIARPGVGITVGDRTGIGDHCFFWGQGGIEIGSDVLFGPGVRVFSENHLFDDLSRPINRQGEDRHPVVIGDNCWIGGGVTILAGVNIGHGCVIGAGSLVAKDLPPDSVAVGVPARIVRKRGLDEGGPADGSVSGSAH
jgi:acetyltransferase-like isoleucine patch superfamily enzyme